MFSKFDTNPQSDETTAADLYEAQSAWEAEQANDDPDYIDDGFDFLDLYDGNMWEDTYEDPIDLYGEDGYFGFDF